MTHPVLGVTGLPCSGKGEVARRLAELGAAVIDVDTVGHDILETPSARDAVRSAFGDGIFDAAGTVNRTALGAIVFADDDALTRLEAILHPPMVEGVRETARDLRRHRPVVLDAALLGVMGLDALCDRVILVDASDAVRRARARDRGWSEADLVRRDRRLASSIARLRATADNVLVNETTLDSLHRQIDSMWKELHHVTEKGHP